MLSFGPRSMPPDLSLEAADTLTLYRALASSSNVPSFNLEPSRFFDEPRFLRQSDIIRYELALKKVVSTLISAFDPHDDASLLHEVLRRLVDSRVSERSAVQLNTPPTREIFAKNLIYLVADLQAQGDLVCHIIPSQPFPHSSCRSQQFCSTSTGLNARSWREIFSKSSRQRKKDGVRVILLGREKSINGNNGNLALRSVNVWRAKTASAKRTQMIRNPWERAHGKARLTLRTLRPNFLLLESMLHTRRITWTKT
jgi:hypothetical protein